MFGVEQTYEARKPIVSTNCEILSSPQMEARLKPNGKGIYENMILGALEFPNSIGDVYTKSSAVKMVQPGNLFYERLTQGHCKGEYGHPKRDYECTDREWIERNMYTEEKNVSHQHTDIRIEVVPMRMLGGKRLPCFIGGVLPDGPYGEVLNKQLSQSAVNVSFSLRAMTNDLVTPFGKRKDIILLNGWDYVTSPGLKNASKYNNVSLESSVNSVQVQIDALLEVAESVSTYNISHEASQLIKNQAREMYAQVTTKVYIPASAQWHS